MQSNSKLEASEFGWREFREVMEVRIREEGDERNIKISNNLVI